MLIGICLPNLSFGQDNLKSLLEIAGKNYPAIAAKKAQAEAAKIDVSLEKNTLLPSLDIAYQANYATFNNITGMNYPGQLIPISGPPSTGNTYDGVPGSAASLLLKWTPITFGQRSASIEYNKKLYERQLASTEDELLRLQFSVAFLYLEIATTQELIKAYQKNIERNEFNLKQVSSLVTAGIRPAVDSLKFMGEFSKARSELYNLQNLLQSQKYELAEMLVTENLDELIINDFLFQNLPVPPLGTDSTQNPVLKIAKFDVEANEAWLRQVRRSWVPKLELWGTAYGRGSGVSYSGVDGTPEGTPTLNKAAGWELSRYNYGVGFQLVFPIINLKRVNLRTRQQEALLLSSQKYLDQTRINLQKQGKVVTNGLTTSLQIAQEVPIEYEANESAYRALQTRYRTGLINYIELIQAQYDLLNAEARLKNAYITSWKALLQLAVINGDINIFLDQIEN